MSDYGYIFIHDTASCPHWCPETLLEFPWFFIDAHLSQNTQESIRHCLSSSAIQFTIQLYRANAEQPTFQHVFSWPVMVTTEFLECELFLW
jgi:hypothetical protein